ncbi:MAG: RNA 3'-terminal phosphate cyclase [Deferrisomatales bacterium]
MVVIDGSAGEGGGQVLRTSLALSLLTGMPFRIENVRAGRKNPGLAAQHLASVQAAVAVGGGRVVGAEKGSTCVTFRPGRVCPGHYRFAVGTAGAASLVLQTVALPLALAGGASSIAVSGGTHVPWSPSAHYLERQWAPALARLGVVVGVRLVRVGFYPRGGGEMEARLQPTGTVSPLRGVVRGKLLRISGLSAVAGLDPAIAFRQARRARERLGEMGVPAEVEVVRWEAPSPGTFLFLEAHCEGGCWCAGSLGERGKAAEAVADEAADELGELLRTGADVDRHMADQLLLPLALARGASELSTARVTRHLTTNAEVIRRFLPRVRIEVEGPEGSPGRVRVDPGG